MPSLSPAILETLELLRGYSSEPVLYTAPDDPLAKYGGGLLVIDGDRGYLSLAEFASMRGVTAEELRTHLDTLVAQGHLFTYSENSPDDQLLVGSRHGNDDTVLTRRRLVLHVYAVTHRNNRI
jgi:hypothetical protein